MTLTDDDTASGSITLTVSPTSVGEDDGATTVTVTATLGGSATLLTATEVTVSVGGGTATSGTDYAAVPDFTVTIPKETASGTGTFTLTPTQDTIAEGDETIDVTGTADGFTVTKAEMTLTDDETAPASITLTTSPTSVLESTSGTTVTVTATLGGSATLLTATEVSVSVGGGSATSGTDYTAVSDFTVTIPKETASGTGTFTLTPTQDDIAEGDESIDVTGNATGFTVTKAEVTLTDDETAPASITLTTSPTSVLESASGTTVTVTATLDGSVTLPGATEVSVSVGGGSATSGTDYTAVSDFTVTIPKETASGTGTFTLTPTQDTIAEGDESIDVTGNATGFTVTKAEVTLTDDETAPAAITLTTSPTSVSESATGTTVTVTATLGGSATLLTATEVTVSVGGGSATSGTDYTAVSDFTVTIPKETASASGTFTLTPTQDTIAEGDESIDVTGNATGFTVTKAEVTLTDDETAPAAITLTTSPTSVLESASGTTVTVTATLDGSATLLTDTDVTVSVGGGSATSGTDYAAVSDFTVTIPKETASGSGTFTLTPTQDTIAEGDESIDVTGTADGFTVTKAEVTLTDDDTASGSITLTVSPTSVGEDDGATTVTVTATLGGSATLLTATEVSVSVGGGTATSGTDYAAVSDFTVTIPKETASGTGTFTLTPTQDTIAEGDESIDVTGMATDFTVTKAEMTLTDDETAPAAITLTASPTSVGEDDGATTVTVTATLDGSATRPGATDVTVSVGGGSATSGTDYTAVSDFTVTIPKETASGTGTFTLTPTQDDIAEGDESIDVTGMATDFTVTKAEMTLTDDETAPAAITLTASPTSVGEDDGATTVTVTATLDGSATRPGATDVTVSVGGGSATSGTDYTAVSDFTVTIPKETASGSGTFTLTPTQDDIAEGDESIDVTGNATGFTVTKAEVTLTDDDTAQRTVSFDKHVFTVTEGATRQVLMQVDLSGPLDREVAIPLTTTHGSGVEANDYVLAAIGVEDYYAGNDAWTSLDGDLVFAPAETGKIVRVTAVDDSIVEDDEVLELGFGTLPEGISPGSIRVARVTITDNDSDDDGDGDNDGANRTPAFTSPVSFTVAENLTAVGTVAASDSDDADSVTGYALAGGADRALFSIDSATGALRFLAPPNHEEPADADSNNVCEVVVEATSGMGERVKTATQTITVTVTNADEQPERPAAPGVDPTAGSTTDLDVSWTEPGRNGGPAIASYELRYRPGGGEWSDWPHAGTGKSTVIEGLKTDTSYQVQVRALNGETPSDWSPSGMARTPKPPPARVRSVRIVSDPGSEGVWSAGERVEVEVVYPVPVVVEKPEDCWSYNADGTCKPSGPFVLLVFSDDARPGYGISLSTPLAPYVGGSGTATLRFAYTVGEDEDGALRVSAADNGILLRGARIRTLEGGEGKPEYTNTRVLQVTMEKPGGSAWTAGEKVRVKVRFTGPAPYTPPDEPQNRDEVVVDETEGAPTIDLKLGDREDRTLARTATYASGSGKDTLVFEYEVADGDGRVGAVEVVADTLAKNGATIRNEEGYDAELDHLGAVQYAQTDSAKPEPPTVDVEDARVREAPGATLDFEVTLSGASSDTVTVDYRTVDASAKAGEDYEAHERTLTFEPGQTSKTIQVTVLDDAHDEGNEKMALVLYRASGAIRDDYLAVGIIENSDPMPRAWLARFGRTASDHVVEAIAERWRGGEAQRPRTHFTLGGRPAGNLFGGGDANGGVFHPAGAGDPALADESVWAQRDRLNAEAPGPAGGRTSGGQTARFALMNALGLPTGGLRDVLMGSSFFYSRPRDEAAGQPGWLGQWSAWGRTAATRFSGADGKLALNGEVATAILGVDSRRDRWLAGVTLSYSEGEGAYTQPQAAGGGVSSTLTSLNPYLQYRFSERTHLWAVAGYGVGGLTLTPEGSESVIDTDLENMMAAFGGRGVFSVRSSRFGAFEFAVRSDALVTNTVSAAADNLISAAGAASRVRLMLEGSGSMPLAAGELKPTLEAGLRYDGGDAETGAGLEIGGGLGYAAGALAVEVRARMLLAHQDAEYEEWGFSGSIRYQPRSGGRGLSVNLGSTWGQAQSGVQSLWTRPDASGLAPVAAMHAAQRFRAELGYGFAGRRADSMWMPFLGVETAGGGAQSLRLGVRLASGPNVEMGLEFGRRDNGRDNGLANGIEGPEHAVQLRGSIRW